MDITVRFVFGVLGNILALFLFLAPVKTFQRIHRHKSTEEFSGVPYVMTLLNNLNSAWYGLPFVSPNNILVTSINGAGIVIESIYTLLFLIWAPKKERIKVFGLLVFVLSIFTAIALVSVLVFHGNDRKVFCGIAASVSSVIMYGSPLSVMMTVIKTRSVEFMPFCQLLACFLCGTCWFVYGLISRDIFLYLPNGVGCALGGLQLALYCICCGNNSQETDMNGHGEACQITRGEKPCSIIIPY